MNKKGLLDCSAQHQITNEEQFKNRRKILSSMGYSLGTSLMGSIPSFIAGAKCDSDNKLSHELKLKPNQIKEITRYNNYMEFSSNKEVIHILAQKLSTSPWTLTIDGEVQKPLNLNLKDLSQFDTEKRIYPLRCVEGWSMVIPWQGFPLCQLIDMVQPTNKARYLEFTSLLRPEQMIGQRTSSLQWPYREGLRLDEAMHPLTFIATGMYGKQIPKQNGAPLRLVVPWKYGFKSAKAITQIRFTHKQPKTTWQIAAPSEYGFYANVNPYVPHPRWSQQRENRIGEMRKKPTLLFNGYEKQVAYLYQGMDLSVHF